MLSKYLLGLFLISASIIPIYAPIPLLAQMAAMFGVGALTGGKLFGRRKPETQSFGLGGGYEGFGGYPSMGGGGGGYPGMGGMGGYPGMGGGMGGYPGMGGGFGGIPPGQFGKPFIGSSPPNGGFGGGMQAFGKRRKRSTIRAFEPIV